MRKNSELIAQHSALWWGEAMKNLIYLLLVIAMMVVGDIAEAQQPKKVFRIGILSGSAPDVSPPVSWQFARLCASVAT